MQWKLWIISCKIDEKINLLTKYKNGLTKKQQESVLYPVRVSGKVNWHHQ